MTSYRSDDLNEEDVRLTADFLWEQEGRFDANPEDYWDRALDIHRRAHTNGLELQAGLASQNEHRDGVSDPHPPEEGHPYDARHPGGANPPATDLAPNDSIHD